MELTPVTTEDQAIAWLEVHNSAVASRSWTPAALTTLLAGSADHRQVIRTDEGRTPVGAGLLVIGAEQVVAWVSVASGERNQGHGGAIWTDLLARLPDHPVEVRVEAADEPSLDFARRRGFSIIRHEPRLVRELAQGPDPRRSDPDSGAVSIVALVDRSDLVAGMWRIAALRPRAEGALSSADWKHSVVAADTSGARRTSLAVIDDSVVGFATLLVWGARPGVASHVGTFVDPNLTGRGVASALKDEQIQWARSHGFTHLEASSDPGNPAKTRLYAGHGYREAPGWYAMVKRRC